MLQTRRPLQSGCRPGRGQASGGDGPQAGTGLARPARACCLPCLGTLGTSSPQPLPFADLRVSEMHPYHTSWKELFKHMLSSAKKVTPSKSLVLEEIKGNNAVLGHGTISNDMLTYVHSTSKSFPCNGTEVSGHQELTVPLFPKTVPSHEHSPCPPSCLREGKIFNGPSSFGRGRPPARGRGAAHRSVPTAWSRALGEQLGDRP